MWWKKWMVACALLLACGAVQETTGRQTAAVAVQPTTDWAEIVAAQRGVVPASLADLDMASLTEAEWKTIRHDVLRDLRDRARWQDAAQRVVYLSTYFADRIDLDAASVPLLESYMFERDQGARILALAAIYSVGHEDTMRHLAQRWMLERSPRVRRLTKAALVEHFNLNRKTTVLVGAPRPAGH